jgi:hypothetical protein
VDPKWSHEADELLSPVPPRRGCGVRDRALLPPAKFLSIGQQFDRRSRHSVLIIGVDQNGRAAGRLRDAAAWRGDHRTAAGHRFQHHQAERFLRQRQHEREVVFAEQFSNAVARHQSDVVAAD